MLTVDASQSQITTVGTLGSLAVSGTTSFNGVTYTWPGSDGNAPSGDGDFLKTDGNGNLSWSNVDCLNTDGSDTMTGNLQMGAGKGIIFEGATANAHETTLSVADPTADHTGQRCHNFLCPASPEQLHVACGWGIGWL